MLMSVLLLAVFCRWGVQGAAASRLAYGMCWVALYARFLHSVIAFDVRRLLIIYAKSGLATLAAITPLTLTYLLWTGPASISLPVLTATVGCGAILWLGIMKLVRHPAFDDLLGLASHILKPLHRFAVRD
jgi:hypothetical protein